MIMISERKPEGEEAPGPASLPTLETVGRSRPGWEPPLRELVWLSLEGVAIWQVD